MMKIMLSFHKATKCFLEFSLCKCLDGKDHANGLKSFLDIWKRHVEAGKEFLSTLFSYYKNDSHKHKRNFEQKLANEI